MGDYPTSASIMWPVNWPQDLPGPGVPDAHVTTLYFGEFEEITFTKLDLITAVKGLAGHNSFALVNVTGAEWFGPEENIPVLTVESEFVRNFRDYAQEYLKARGIYREDTFPEYKPHVTVSESVANGTHPKTLLLSPLQVWWGDERISLQ